MFRVGYARMQASMRGIRTHAGKLAWGSPAKVTFGPRMSSASTVRRSWQAPAPNVEWRTTLRSIDIQPHRVGEVRLNHFYTAALRTSSFLAPQSAFPASGTESRRRLPNTRRLDEAQQQRASTPPNARSAGHEGNHTNAD